MIACYLLDTIPDDEGVLNVELLCMVISLVILFFSIIAHVQMRIMLLL